MNETAELEIIQPSALESVSRAEIDVAIATARKYPQHQPNQLSSVKQAMMSFATLDEETAKSCFYSVPRAGKNIQGISVRLAEIALSCYGNARAGSRIIHVEATGANPHVVVQAVIIDLEKNVSVSIEKRRRITGKKSKGGVPDEDDINLAANACSAIAFRDAVRKIIPGALINPVYEAAKKVAIGDASTLKDRRAKCVDAFSKMGVTKEMILTKLEKKSVDDIDLSDLETLIGLFNAIRESDITIDEAFAPPAKVADLSDLNAKLKAEAAASAKPVETPSTQTVTSPAPESKAAPEPSSAPTATVTQPVAEPEQVDPNKALSALLHALGLNEIKPEQVLAFCRENKLATDKQTHLSELSTSKLVRLTRAVESNPEVVAKMKAL